MISPVHATRQRPYASALEAWGTAHADALVLTGDLASSCETDRFRDRYPDRFFELGMAEQNMIGVAAGLARTGFRPLVHSFGVFLTRRPYDQVAISIALPRLRVALLGFLPGLTTPGGPTHQAIDDLALMRALPGMTVLETGDAAEVESCLDAVAAADGPVYCRVLRGDVPLLFDTPMQLGHCRVLELGGDVCVISSGVMTEEALRARDLLAAAGVQVSHLHVSTIKPLDDPTLLSVIEAAPSGVVVVENHLVTGGLGSAVAELVAEAGLARRVVRLGLRDTFAESGTREYLFHRHGMSAPHIARAVSGLLGIESPHAPLPLPLIPLPAAASSSRPEAL